MDCKKVINIAFSAIAGLSLAVVCMIAICSSCGIAFPKQLGVNESYSELEGRPRQAFPELTTETITQGVFQSNLEQSIADHIPFRNAVLLWNAALQRQEIELANIACGWPAYPTKLNSEFAVVPSRTAVIHTAMSPTKKVRKAAKAWSKAIAQAAKNHPDVRFVYDILDDTYSSSTNPTHDLISKNYTKDWVDENIVANLGNRVVSIYDPIESEDELFSQWFLTEHHWRIGRALSSYNKIGSYLGWKEYSADNAERMLDRWYGSSARSGLDLEWTDSFDDVMTDFSHLSCKINGVAGDRGRREAYVRGDAQPLSEPIFHYYHQWYGGPAAEIVYENPNGNGKTCLFIEQSYGVAIERYIALNYSRVVCADPQNCVVDKSFDELIDAWGVDDVVIQFGYSYMPRVQERSPKLFA